MHRQILSNTIQDCKLEAQKLTEYSTSSEAILHVQEHVHSYVFSELLRKKEDYVLYSQHQKIYSPS